MARTIQTKRVYEPASADDGLRVLVDRMWPRGLSKASLKYDLWCKELAPSTELRKWFGHKPELWDEFRSKYTQELGSQQALAEIAKICAAAGEHALTLLYSARDTEHNQALVLAEFIQKHHCE